MGDHRGSRELWTRGGGAALVVIVLALVLFVRPGGDDADQPSAAPSPEASASAAPDPPSEEEWCRGFRRLADAQAVYAAAPDTRGAELIREAADDIVAMGVPATMPVEARGGFYTAISGIYGSLGETLDPAAVPGAADGDQIAGSDAAFSSYLNEFCPA